MRPITWAILALSFCGEVQAGRFGSSVSGGRVSVAAGQVNTARINVASPVARPATPTISRTQINSAAVHGPFGGASSVNVNRARVGTSGVSAITGTGRTFTTPGGTTIAAGRVSGVGASNGRVGAGRASGVAVIGPNGNVHAIGGASGAVVGPNGVAVGRSQGSLSATPTGITANRNRVGVVAGPGGVAAGASSSSIAVGPFGTISSTNRVGVASNRFGTRFVSATTIRNQGLVVRQNFGAINSFNAAWYARHTTAWVRPGWPPNYAWRAATWGWAGSYFRFAPTVAPIYYNYGDNVTYVDNRVYYGSQLVATAADYFQQAVQIAEAGRRAVVAAEGTWEPLGVFALVYGDEPNSNDLFQFAVSPEGIVRGNYQDLRTDTVQPIAGSLDRTSQRLAWTVGGRPEPVFETGLYNLTLAEAPILVHTKAGTTQATLVRIEQPQ